MKRMIHRWLITNCQPKMKRVNDVGKKANYLNLVWELSANHYHHLLLSSLALNSTQDNSIWCCSEWQSKNKKKFPLFNRFYLFYFLVQYQYGRGAESSLLSHYCPQKTTSSSLLGSSLYSAVHGKQHPSLSSLHNRTTHNLLY